MYYEDDETLMIEQDDKCFNCCHFTEQTCPLISSLSAGLVFMDTECESIGIDECPMFEEYEPHLTLVQDNTKIRFKADNESNVSFTLEGDEE